MNLKELYSSCEQLFLCSEVEIYSNDNCVLKAAIGDFVNTEAYQAGFYDNVSFAINHGDNWVEDEYKLKLYCNTDAANYFIKAIGKNCPKDWSISSLITSQLIDDMYYPVLSSLGIPTLATGLRIRNNPAIYCYVKVTPYDIAKYVEGVNHDLH